MKILIAEDGNDHARILMAILKGKKFTVTRVSTGTAAYRAIKKGPPPDLLLTDIMMPEMSGFELLAKLKEEDILPPTIVFTSKQREEDVLRGLGYGALDYITKPFSPAVVLARIDAALKKNKKK